MTRTILFFLGTISAYTTWVLMSGRPQVARKPIPASQAAALLQEAWADHHTRA